MSTPISCPLEIVPQNEDQKTFISKFYPNDLSINKRGNFFQPGNIFLPEAFTQEIADRIYNIELRPDDVWIVTYPKCGTTWTQEIVWQIVNGCQFEVARKVPLMMRSPFLEFQTIHKDAKPGLISEVFSNSIEFVEKAPSPRVIKTHLPLNMLNPKLLDTCKVIVVTRNPKDCCVSFYHHTSLMADGYFFEGSFEDYQKLFRMNLVHYGSFWDHLKTSYKFKDSKNLEIIKYEDMKKDLKKVINRLCDFLEKPLQSDQVDKLIDHAQIQNFRDIIKETIPKTDDGFQDAMVKFFRKGEVGDWKNYLKDNNEWDKWIDAELKGSGIEMEFVA